MLCAQVGFNVIKMEVALWFFIYIVSLQMTSAAVTVKVEPKEIILPEGETLNAKCILNVSIASCDWTMLLGGSYEVINHQESLKEVCDITIQNITEKHKGNITCVLVPSLSEGMTLYGNVTVDIAKAPRAPQISITDPINGKNPQNIYKENQTIRAACTIEFGKPEATISWFIGNDQIKEGLSKPNITDLGEDYGGQKKITQTLERNLTFLDNGKQLRCVARHSALGNGTLHHPTFTLNVLFPPKLEHPKPLVFTNGQPGEIVVTIYANPKPSIEWLIGEDKVQEGVKDATGRFHARNLTERDEATWDAVLHIERVMSEDEKKYSTLKAINKFGDNEVMIPMSVFSCPNSCPTPATSVTTSPSLSPCPTPATAATTCPSLSPCPTQAPTVTTCPPLSPDLTTGSTAPAEVTAWVIAGISTTILLIILIKSVYSKLTRRGSYSTEMAEMAYGIRDEDMAHEETGA